MAGEICPLCGNFAEAKDVRFSDKGVPQTAWRITCTTCGRYELTMLFETMLERLTQSDRYRLSGLTRRATERGERIELSTAASDLLDRNPAPSPPEQADLILDYIEAHSSPGVSVPIDPKRDYPIAEAAGAEGLRFVLNALLDQKLIERTDQSALPHYRLTMAGYERVKQRRSRRVPTSVSRPGWEQVDRQIGAAHERLESAQHPEEFQQVGLLCREALISAAQVVFEPERHATVDGVAASATDTRRMLEAVIVAHLAGEPNEEARAVMRAAVRLALALQHDRGADRRTARLCYEATVAVVRMAAVLGGEV